MNLAAEAQDACPVVTQLHSQRISPLRHVGNAKDIVIADASHGVHGAATRERTELLYIFLRKPR